MKTSVTIKDIAEQLNLSRNTVAKALNGKYVPEATRIRVLNKAIELNYKSLNTKIVEKKEEKYKILLLACQPLNNLRFFYPIIKEIENYCFINKHDLFQFTYNTSISTFDALKDYIDNLNINGIIAIESFDSNFVNKLFKLNLPITFIDCCTNFSSFTGSYDIVETSNFTPIFDITKSLINQYNLKHFTYVGDETHCLSFQKRYHGMLCGLFSMGLSHTKDEDILKSDNFDYGNIEMLKSAIINLKYKTDCFICSNDFIARNICKALESFGKKIPDDAFVVGFDNVPESVASSPKITTVSSDSKEIGNKSIVTLINRIKNPNTSPILYTIKSSIILRQSTQREKKKLQ